MFTRTRLETGRVANELAVRGFPAEALSGDLTQVAREHVMNRFREGKIEVLVATDVAARGIDIENISHVINFDTPQFPEVYVHRVGRTGRAGRKGTAITLITPRQRYQMRRIEEYTNQTIPLAELPTKDEIQEIRSARLEEQMIKWLKRDRCKVEKEQVRELIEAGYDPIGIAAAALKLAKSEEKKRPIGDIGELVYPENKSKKGRGGRGRRFERGGKNDRGRPPRGQQGRRKGDRRKSDRSRKSKA
ncbi:MAG: C-terminal helicase domain-containing protein [Chloroflexota bacterium]